MTISTSRTHSVRTVPLHFLALVALTSVLMFSAKADAGSGADSYTSLLLHADGGDATTLFTDVSGKTHGVSVGGNAQVDTAQSKFGGASILFDGAGDYILLDGSSDFAFGSGDFTVEFWFRPNTVSGTHTLYDSRTDLGSSVHVNLYQNATALALYVSGADRITGGTLSAGTWYHIALARSGTATKLFVDGTQVGSTYTDSNSYLNAANRPVIGNSGDLSTYPLNGWIDEVRVSKGIARYTANFTAPTEPFGGNEIRITTNVNVTSNLDIRGSVSKGSGTFVIDHPLRPRSQLLYHSFVESPDAKNIYDGIVKLDENGEATIEFPEYFQALNESFRYQFFPLSEPMPDLYIKQEVRDNAFVIAGGKPGGRVSWQITGVRHDPFIIANPIRVEVPKGPNEIVNKGEYVFPEYEQYAD